MSETTPDLRVLHLEQGGHRSREDGVCLMEAVAWYAGREHTDAPPCVCPVLGEMGRALNDILPDAQRQGLIPVIPFVVGTADDGLSERRGLMAADWIIRTYTPVWLRLARLNDEAGELEALPEIVDTATMTGAMGALNRARKSANAAWDAAGDAAGDAARAAAWDAAWAAAWAAAGDAAGAAAGDAAWAAAWDAAWAAAWAAAGDAAGDAAWAAAWDAAWDALAPTVATLQGSAIDLYRRMAELRAGGSDDE